MDCLFCRIAQRKIPASICYEDDFIVAFEDIAPKAPQHKLIIPRKHIATLNNLEAQDAILIGKIYLVAKQLAAELQIAETGYRVVMNCNQDAGQSVFHIHAHLLGGREMKWPPG